MVTQDPWTRGNSGRDTKDSKNKDGGDFSSLLKELFGEYKSPFGSGDNFKFPSRWLIILIPLLVVIYSLTGFYIVKADEEGVIMIFGKYVGSSEAGLHYNLPAPFGRVYNVRVKAVNYDEIGGGSVRNIKSRGEGIMITGDENIVDVDFGIQWRVKNAYNYLFKIRDNYTGETVRNAAESAMREVVGQNKLFFVLDGKGRQTVSSESLKILQTTLNEYDTGIEILSIQLKKVDPPESVIEAFRDVQSARADKERLINESYSYRNDVIPKAKGEASKIVLEAEAYESEVVNLAEGSAKRFLALYGEYSKHPDAVRIRLYIEGMEGILSGLEKIIVSDDLNGLLSYLPLDSGGRFMNNSIKP